MLRLYIKGNTFQIFFMAEARLNYLFLKYLENTCSQLEMEEFFAYIRKAKTDDHLRGLIRKVYEEIKQSHPSLTYVDQAGKLFFTDSINVSLSKNGARSGSAK